jgi:hypothetical protein
MRDRIDVLDYTKALPVHARVWLEIDADMA